MVVTGRSTVASGIRQAPSQAAWIVFWKLRAPGWDFVFESFPAGRVTTIVMIVSGRAAGPASCSVATVPPTAEARPGGRAGGHRDRDSHKISRYISAELGVRADNLSDGVKPHPWDPRSQRYPGRRAGCRSPGANGQ